MKGNSTTIDVGNVFSDMPFGRDEKDGDSNGYRFRKDFLLKELENYEYVTVDPDKYSRLPIVFRRRSFAGLVIYEKFTKEEVLRRLIFVSEYESVKSNILRYINEAKPAAEMR